MKKILTLIEEELVPAFEKAGVEASYAKVTVSNRPDLCEFQCNGAMAAAKKYKKAPIMIAKDVVAALQDSAMFEKAEAVNPGFINLKLAGDYLAGFLNDMQADENLSVEKVKEPRKIIVDYGGANVAKPLHVGHLRSAIIGESIKRMGRFMGHEVIGDVHLGDWGLQMGLIITELRYRQPELAYLRKAIPGNIRRRRRLRSVILRKFIRRRAKDRRRTKRTARRRWRRQSSSSREIGATARSGSTLCACPLPT